MNTEYSTTDSNVPEVSIKEKQLQSEEADKKNSLSDKIQRLYFGIKELNQRLENFSQESNLQLHQ